MHSFLMYLFYASTCFEQQVLIIRRSRLYQYIIWYNTLWWQTVAHQSVLYQMMYSDASANEDSSFRNHIR
jgi:hypothetical protein